MRRTRIKFCGITCAEDAQAAAAAGADAVGMVLHPPSPSAVDIDGAADIVRALPPFVESVALLVNAAPDFVGELIRRARPSLLQFHGDESVDECHASGMPYIKACRVGAAEDIAQTIAEHRDDAKGILLDAKAEKIYGGSGKKFDWTLIPADSPLPLIIAGGLTAETVGELIVARRPWAVDVSSGIGCNNDRRRKDSDKMRAFIGEARHADGE